MKVVYVIRGSEDGTYAVYSNKKSAVDRAYCYVENPVETKKQLLKDLTEHHWCTISGKRTSVTCEIDTFVLEK